MPASIEPSFQGTAHAFESSLANESILILAAIVTVYIVLGMLYESFIHPITILSTLPSAGVGAILALVLFKKDLDVIALIGIILLIGIVKKNAIMMIDFALEAERNEGKPPEEAIYQACLLRFRPIMMTTMAALLGAVPLAFGSGVGSELRQAAGHLHHRRTAGQPGADAVHDAGDLSVLRTDRGLGRPVPRLRRTTNSFFRADIDVRLEHMSISTPFIQRPVATTLLLVALTLAGGDRLYAVAGLGVAGGGLPDHHCQRQPAGRESRGDGGVGRDAARKAVHAHRGRHGNDVQQLGRIRVRSRSNSI